MSTSQSNKGALMKTKADALIDIICDAQSGRANPTSYKRVCRALKVLELDTAEQERILMHLDYHSDSGQPYVRYVQAVRS